MLNTETDFSAALTTFLAHCQAFIAGAHARHGYKNVACPALSLPKGGRKYRRIVIGEGCHRSVYGFVRVEDGAVFKAAGWKSPALNFSRGSIFGEFKPSAGWEYSIG